NAENPRNAVSAAAHGFLTRDGVHPLELLSIAKEQMRQYESVEYLVGSVATVERVPEGFAVHSAAGRVSLTKRLIIATGYRDELSLLGIPGLEEVYGRSVFPCPFCDGFEHADERLAIFAGDAAEHFVPVVGVWSEDLVVFTNGRVLSPSVRKSLTSRGVSVEEASIAKLVSEKGRLVGVELTDGRCIARDAGFIRDDFSVPATDFATRLGIPLVHNMWNMEVSEADEAGRTSEEGVYLVGDTKSGFGGLTAAAYEGSMCVQHIVHEIASENWEEILTS
ncbi:MAG: NAD(P)/FAD-dependent oxidoreductase, partial [Kofleriaceae bacterium]|nr:NAD(P)/FAD-dependent oxidoreductase [Kofleriaceae bacterium]